MKRIASGSCLCGAVTFDILGAFERFYLCYCSRCRKGSGSAHAANLFSAGGDIEWLRGQSKIKTFQLPGTRHAKSFCSDCGSALPFLQMDGGLLVVPAGSLDGDIDIRPDARISYGDRAGWTDELKSVPTLNGLPG